MRVRGVWRTASAAVLVMVMLMVAELPAVRVGLEEKAQDASAGRPEQERAILPAKEPVEVRVIW